MPAFLEDDRLLRENLSRWRRLDRHADFFEHELARKDASGVYGPIRVSQLAADQSILRFAVLRRGDRGRPAD